MASNASSDDEQIWRENVETGIKALNAGDLSLAEVAFLDSLKFATSRAASAPLLERAEHTLKLLSELAARMYFERDEDRAIQLCRQVIDIGKPLLGGDSNPVFTAACLLADYYFDLEQEQDTTPKQAVLEELAGILTEAAPVARYEDAEMVGNGLYMVASLYYSSEQFATAEKLMRKTLRLREVAPPSLNAALLQDYELFTNTLCWQSKFPEAKESAARWLELADAQPSGQSVYKAQIYLTLGEIYRMLEDESEAENCYRLALAVHEDADCADCDEMAAILRSYGRYLQSNSRPDEAKELMRRAAKINDEDEDNLFS